MMTKSDLFSVLVFWWEWCWLVPQRIKQIYMRIQVLILLNYWIRGFGFKLHCNCNLCVMFNGFKIFTDDARLPFTLLKALVLNWVCMELAKWLI